MTSLEYPTVRYVIKAHSRRSIPMTSLHLIEEVIADLLAVSVIEKIVQKQGELKREHRQMRTIRLQSY